MDMATIIQDRVQQYSTVNKNKDINYSTVTVQYSYHQVKAFVETLDRRVYCNSKFLPFYVSATKKLGMSRVNELQHMVLADERIDQPNRFCAERVFWCLLKDEIAASTIKTIDK